MEEGECVGCCLVADVLWRLLPSRRVCVCVEFYLRCWGGGCLVLQSKSGLGCVLDVYGLEGVEEAVAGVLWVDCFGYELCV